MKKFLVCAIAILAVVAVTVPASALEVKYGGLFRARVLSQSDFTSAPANLEDPSSTLTDHLNRLDQRLRIFMYFVSSENLRVVTKFETNAVWGDVGYNVGAPGNTPIDNSGGGNVGADVNSFVVKNAYLDFAIPNTPLRSFVGVQGLALIDSWVIDDDFSAAVLQANFDPVKVTVGYVAGQNWDTKHEGENVDDAFVAVDYVGGPFRASLVGFYQNAHNTQASIFPMYMSTPVYDRFPDTRVAGFVNPFDPDDSLVARDNQLFDLAFSLGYKLDFLTAYVNFVKNFGSVELRELGDVQGSDVDYTGWMIDAGLTYFCGPWTFNVGGFYTSGQELEQAADGSIEVKGNDELHWFTYPLATTKYFSEIIGGGILDNTAPNSGYWSGYGFPTNLWTATVGAAFQVLPQTKLSASYWYFGTAEDVPGRQRANGIWKMENSIGHEFDFYLTQTVVDKLTLDLVGAYLLTDDAYRPQRNNESVHDDDVYELGARLQWSF